MVSAGAYIKKREEISRLSGGSQHRGDSTLQGRDTGSHGVAGGIGQAGIEITAVFQVEKTAHLVRRLIFESRALYDGKLTRLAALGGVACMEAEGIQFTHGSSFFHTKIDSLEKTDNNLHELRKYF